MKAPRVLLSALVVLLGGPPSARAADGAFGDQGGFRSVLAGGHGQNNSATDLAGFLGAGTVPSALTDQQGLYSGVSRVADGLTAATLGKGWKGSSFRLPDQDAASVESPRAGVEIVRDAVHRVPRVYGTTRSDLMWGAGYVTAEDRLFLMDVLRHTAQASTVELLGASAAKADAAQLTHQDATPAELEAQLDALPERFGQEGAQGRQDVLDYVAGINAYIAAARLDPTRMPAEYAALGATLRDWRVGDSLSVAVLLVAQFTSNGGSELVTSQLHDAFLARAGAKRGEALYEAFRARTNPEAVTITRRTFPQNAFGKPDARADGTPDAGTATDRIGITQGPGAAAQRSARAGLPAWAQRLSDGLKLPHHASNALLIDAAHSADGRPLAAMGPQVGYYTPQLFTEYELHGPGFDASGVAFPGAAPYVLIGHGKDFAWTGTTPNGDTVDTFAEELCEPGGAAPSARSEHYVHDGQCVPLIARDQTMTTPVAPTSPGAPQTITLRALRSVHGTVIAYGKVDGKPVAYTESHETAGQEFSSLLAFKQLAEGRAVDGPSFQAVMRNYVGEENWFYVGRKDIAWIRSGLVPRKAPGTVPDTPITGTGAWDWRGVLGPEANPRDVNPVTSYLASWNNKESPADPSPSGTWSFGSVQRQQLLVRPLRVAFKRGGGKVRLEDLARISVRAATADLRGTEVLAWLERVIGPAPDDATRAALKTLHDWRLGGAQRRDVDADGKVDEGAAAALMDTWWPRLVRAMFAPALGDELIDRMAKDVIPLPERGTSTFFFDGWWGYVQADLRRVRGRKVTGWPKKALCGGGGPKRCRAVVLASLREAIAKAPAGLAATCPEAKPPTCDQIVPITAGAVEIPPFPFHNRGTFHQLVEVGGS